MIFLAALPDPVLYVLILLCLLILALVITLAVRAHREKITTGEEALIGSEARVLEWHGKHGEVHTWGERWAAESDIVLKVKTNDTVYVTGKKKLLLYVSNIKPVKGE